MKTKDWFENKLNDLKNDPEFLREYIDLLNDEIEALESDKKYLMSELNAANSTKQSDGAEADIRFLLSFVPDWAKVVPKGLDPTFYGTLTYEGDLEVKKKVDEIIERVEGSAHP